METIGRYSLLEEVARGGMGAVWRARAPDGQAVALKLLLAGAQASPLQRRRFAGEAAALQRLRHRAVVPLLDSGEAGGVPWLALEWVEGESLEQRLQRTGPLAPPDAVELVGRLAEALEHCHARGVLHRDLKPGNVLLRRSDGAALLTDFGLARDLLEAGPLRTATGVWLGTPGWWPPEQARGERQAIGPRSDVYGLGALLYAALTARPPQDGADLQAQLGLLDRLPPPPSAHRPEVPAWLDAVCLRALDPDPARRFTSAAELAAALERGAPPDAGPGRGASAAALLGAAGVVSLAGLALVLVLASAPVAPEAADKAPEEVAGVAPSATASAVPAASAAADELEALLQEGFELYAAGRVEEAWPLAERARARAPRSVAALNLRGLLRRAQGDLSGAEADFTAAIELEPDNSLPWCNRGNLRVSLGDARGVADLERAVELDPGNASNWNSRGNARQGRRDLRGALADYDRALELRPDYVLALENRGVVRAQLGDPGGLADVDRAIELSPLSAGSFVSRASVLARLGDAAGERRALDRAIELDPRQSVARNNRCNLRKAEGDLRGALEDIEAAVEVSPSPRRIAVRGGLKADLGLPGAVEDLERALALEPGADWAASARRKLDEARRREAGGR